MTLKRHQFDHVVKKFKLKTRNSGDLLAWFEVDGKLITRTKRSKGSGDLPGYRVRQQLKLNEDQFRTAVACKLSREDYVKILREKGLL